MVFIKGLHLVSDKITQRVLLSYSNKLPKQLSKISYFLNNFTTKMFNLQ